jgi:hypothetical protein
MSKSYRCTRRADGTRVWPRDMPPDLRATAEATYIAEAGKISRWYTCPENAQTRIVYPNAGPVYVEARDLVIGGDEGATGGTAVALAAIKKALAVHSLMLPDAADRVGKLGAHLKTALKALSGGVTAAGGLDDTHAGDDKTQAPSRSYRLQRMAHAEAEIMRSMPNSNAAKRLKSDWALEEIKSDQAQDDARIEKDQHHERWRLKDPCAVIPLWRDLSLYSKKPKEKERKDPWIF